MKHRNWEKKLSTMPKSRNNPFDRQTSNDIGAIPYYRPVQPSSIEILFDEFHAEEQDRLWRTMYTGNWFYNGGPVSLSSVSVRYVP